MKSTKVFRPLITALAVLAGAAQADVVHNLAMTFQSGAQFTGTLTFKNDYSSLLDASGSVTSGYYPGFTVGWTWYQGAGPIDSQNEDALPNTLEDYLMQGPDIDHSDFNQIGISWFLPVNAGTPQLAITGATFRASRSINASQDVITSFSVGEGSLLPNSTVPEPGSAALMGVAALAGLAGLARGRKRHQPA